MERVRSIRRCVVLGFLVAGALVFASSLSAKEAIAVIDYADQWTQVRGLTEGLDKLGIPYTDITDDAMKGNLPLKGHAVLFLSAMYTNNATLHQTMDDNPDVIADFVRNGGVVIEPTQADQNEANVDWLPSPLVIVRSDPDRPDFTIVEKNHPLFNEPNKLTDDNFVGWRHQGWPTVWEVIAKQEGFTVLAESGANMAIGEADFGSGKFVMLCLAPDKYAIKGNDDNTKENALLFLENLASVYLPKAVSPEGLLTTTWAALRSE